LAAKLADGKLTVVEDFELKEVSTKNFRTTLDTLGVEKTALLVDGSKDNRNLELSTRNLEGVELVPGNQVHPYHLLRYDTAIFSQATLEKLQNSLKATAPKRKAEVA
jgi:large subunit ribosomal protein L4